jgi:hypothetical protein
MAKKKTLANAESDLNVNDFIETIDNADRRSDCYQIVEIMKEVTGHEPKIWGQNMIGFGRFKYQRKNGDEFEWYTVGCSPAKAHMSVYLMYNLEEETETLKRLGPNKIGKGCLYIKKLELVDLGVLKEMIVKTQSPKTD